MGMTDVEIKSIPNGVSFVEYLGEIFVEHGVDFAKMLCENKLSIETERTIIFNLKDHLDNDRQLRITLGYFE